MENVSHKGLTSGVTRSRPDFDGEWCMTWLRLHPERISHLAMGSTAFDKPDDAKVLSMAEQWLYAPTTRLKDKRQQLHQRHQHHLQHLVDHPLGADLIKSVTLDGVRRRYHSPGETTPPSPSGSEIENQYQAGSGCGRSCSRHSNRIGRTSSEDDFLVTASDPEPSSLRFTSEGRLLASPTVLPSSLDRRVRRASVSEVARLEKGKNAEQENVGKEDVDPIVTVVKTHRHRLRRRGSLNK
ncbi:unnamed protein product, partial [Hydatigera taeniaeformis]|uniref:Uncharacterized protein n=1 Tax=Hydatigena taeniaeformis TaxID=6205 RepID=A0A0R3WYD9_HYDTA